MSRSRQTGTESFELVAVQYKDGVEVWRDNAFTVGLPANHFEKISDEEPGMKRYGNCIHRSKTSSLDHSPCEWVNPANGSTYRWNNRAVYAEYCPPITPYEETLDWNQLSAEAYQTMKPSLSSGFSLTNFVAELAQMKTMFRLFDRSKNLLRNSAGAHLNWEFGWKLFISDLIEIWNKLHNYKALLEDYKSKQGRVLVRHFKKVLVRDDISKETNVVSYKTHTTERRHTVTYHATMRYVYSVPKLDSEYAETLALMDALGVKLTPSVIWNGIPFSFVVDWFLSVGSFLESREADYLESKVTILDFCHSVTEEAVDHLYSDMNGSHIFHGSVTRRLYNRHRAIPNSDDFGVVLSHRYGSRQVLLSAALLVA